MIYIFSANLTGEDTKKVHEELVQFFADFESKNEKKIFFDLNQLENVDIAGLQLLLAVRKTIQKKGYSFALLNKSPYLQQLLKQTGADDILDDGGY